MTPLEVREISLTKGQVTRVTLADYNRFSGWSWYADWSEDTQSFYAARRKTENGRNFIVKLHREILGLKRGDPRQGDHIDRNSLNNVHTDDPLTNNLRIASRGQNQHNRGKTKRNTSGYKGVYWDKKMEKWKAQICVDWKVIFLGYFDTKEEAHAAYCAAAKKHHGEFARGG